MIATLLAALALGVPVSCEPDTSPDLGGVEGRYIPLSIGGPRVLLGPTACISLTSAHGFRCDRRIRVRQQSGHFGALVLAHELAHYGQDLQRRPFSEKEANEIAQATWAWVLDALFASWSCPIRQ